MPYWLLCFDLLYFVHSQCMLLKGLYTLIFMFQTHTFISHTQTHTKNNISLSVCCQGSKWQAWQGRISCSPPMFSPPLFGPIRRCHHLAPQSVLQTVQSSCSNSLEPQVLICYFDLIASQGFVCEFHHAYNTDGHGIWLVKVQSWINAFLFLITHVNIEISLNKHQRPALSRVFLKVMDHSWNRSAALIFLRPPILSK